MIGADSILASTAGNAALISFALYMVVVFVLAGLANREQSGKSFLNEYFLGSRNLGMWAFAFTYAATSASGGSFMGFPSLIYTHGWVMALWIGGYIIVPLVAIGLIAKRLNQVARKSGSITVPELLRKRLGSDTVGTVATVLLVFFQFFFLLAQFKAGAKIMTTLLGDVEIYQAAVAVVDRFTAPIPWVGAAEADYLLCLLVFAASVVAYTAWGGFRAVVWTDMMQGVIMGLGVVILLGLALTQVGGLSNATQELSRQVPPRDGNATLVRMESDTPLALAKGAWLELPVEEKRQPFVRLKEAVEFPEGHTELAGVPVIEVRTSLKNATELKSIRAQVKDAGVRAQSVDVEGYQYGDDKPGVYVSAPGPKSGSTAGFLPIMLAVSFFCFWPFAGAAQPSYMARQMAFKDIPTLRHSIIFVALYFSLIYFPLIIIFTCGRVLLPGWEIDADRVMPEMATFLTSSAGVPWLAGLLVAAPFAAVMSSVDSFLLLVSGSVVRDVYQRKNSKASEAQMKKVTYWTTVGVGALAMLAMLNPPQFLQDLIVFGSGGLGASFLMPVILTLYWPRLTPRATVAGMLSGGGTMAAFYLIGYLVHDKFSAYELLSLHPFIWSVLVSALVMLIATKGSRPTDPVLVEKYFGNVGNKGGNI
jgi:Na+/pantothenate symporter